MAHQAAMFSAGSKTFDSLLSLMTGSLEQAGMPIKPELPKVDLDAAEDFQTQALPSPPTTQLPSPSANPFAGGGGPGGGGGGGAGAGGTGQAGYTMAPGQPQVHQVMGQPAHQPPLQPVQAYPAISAAMTLSSSAPPAYSSTPGIPLVPAAGTGTGAVAVAVAGAGGPPPPPYEVPSQTMQQQQQQQHLAPPPFQQQQQQQLQAHGPPQAVVPSWTPAGVGTGTAAPPPSYHSDPFAAVQAPSPAPAPAPSDVAFSSGHGMAMGSTAAISTASPFGDTPFDGGSSATMASTSSNGFPFPEPVAAPGVDFPANLPAHLGGTPGPAAHGGRSSTSGSQGSGGWQTFE